MPRHAPRIPKLPLVWNREPVSGASPKHLTLVAQLPCLGCGLESAGSAHHLLRVPDGRKGMGIRNLDKDSVPLCPKCHLAGYPGSLHASGDEPAWFAARHIDAVAVATALWRVTSDAEAMRNVILKARARAELSRREYERSTLLITGI